MGYQVPPTEIEDVVNAHPSVKEVAVIGLAITVSQCVTLRKLKC